VVNRYIPLIIEKLRPIDPYKIILFGSHAYGNPTRESDIDIIVVTNDDHIPKNFKEKSVIYLFVSRKIRDISSITPIDLLVYTKAEYEQFIRQKSLFSRMITKEGKEL
jgi:predicted nucleotidyltransferase